MSTFISPELLVVAHAKHPHQQAAEFLSFTSPSDGIVSGPHPDIFESELDLSLAEAEFDLHQLQNLPIVKPDVFNYVRQDTLPYGPPSIITTSSTSAYDSLSSNSESLYNYAPSTYSSTFSCDLNMDFAAASLSAQEYNTASAQDTLPTDSSPDYYGTSGNSPISVTSVTTTAVDEFENGCNNTASSAGYPGDPTFSEYGGSDYYIQQSHPFDRYQTSISPMEISSQAQPRLPAPTARLPSSVGADLLSTFVSSSPYSVSKGSSAMQSMHKEEPDEHPKKKYRCIECGRLFARAYNLKTHKETHDRNRRKPFVCDVESCKRPFSRKHDLQRHKVSLHQNERAGKEARISHTAARDDANTCERCGRSSHKGCMCSAAK